MASLKERLAAMGGETNILVIGYSGLDVEVTELLQEAGSIRRLAIVDADPESVQRNFENTMGSLDSRCDYLAPFAAWAQSSGPEDLVAELSGAS